MPDRKVYHFLSSAARRQYAEDIIRILALPYGVRHRFRYKKTVLSESVIEDIKRKKIEGSKCVISFLYVEKGEPPRVIPCRTARVIKAGFFGPFAVIEFAVQDFLFSPNASDFTDRLRKSADSNIPEWASEYGKADLDGDWAFSTPELTAQLEEGYSLSIFSNTVVELSSLYPFNEEEDAGLNPFFHVIFLENNKKAKEFEFSDADLERSIKAESGWLSIKSGKKYLVRVHHFFHQPGRFYRRYRKNMTLDLDGLAPGYPDSQKLGISSEYDVKDVTFRAISSPITQRKRVTIFLESGEPDSTEGAFADIQIPVKVEPAITKGIFLTLLIAVGVAVPAAIGASELEPLKLLLMVVFGLLAGVGAVFGLRSGL